MPVFFDLNKLTLTQKQTYHPIPDSWLTRSLGFHTKSMLCFFNSENVFDYALLTNYVGNRGALIHINFNYVTFIRYNLC